MYISSELIIFFEFIIIGIIISIVFDFFRAYRKINKTSTVKVIIQDIIFFFIATIIVTSSIIFLLKSNIRLYIFMAIFLGCLIYLSVFSKFIMKLEINFLKKIKYIKDIIILPIELNIKIFRIICIFLKKNTKKCCKKFLYMLSLICKFIFKFKFKVFNIQKLKLKKIKFKIQKK